MAEGGFRDLELRVAYGPGDDPLNAFYIPVLSRAVRYDRSAGFFSSGALVAAAAGLARLVANRGRMRLLVGAQLSEEDVAAIQQGASLEAIAQERLIALLQEPEDELARRRLEVLAWMVAVGTLEIKVVLPVGPDGRPVASSEAAPYYHAKKGLLVDSHGDRVGFSGSVNETLTAWRQNFEEFHVFRSWEPGERPHLVELERYFEELWEGRRPDWLALPVGAALHERLLRFRPSEPPAADPLEETRPALPRPADSERVVAAFIRDAGYLPGASGAVGRATAAIRPWPHQERVAASVVDAFPEGFLLADEVGLGKTIEVGLVLRDLYLSGAISRALILAPASVLGQWQDELREKFALDVPIYDGSGLVGPGPDHVATTPAGENPWESAGLVLASSQLVKRRDRRTQLLTAPDWDLVVVDEAHHARRKDFVDVRERRPNRLLELLEGTDGLSGLASKTKALLLVTATPMQVHQLEVWDLLIQLGQPGRWGASPVGFLRYFRELRRANEAPDEADWAFLAAMAKDELTLGGPVDERLVSHLRQRLGAASWERVQRFFDAPAPQRVVRQLKDEERSALVGLLRHLTPLRRRMFRHTRALLRRYYAQGLLPTPVPQRRPEARWIELTPAEADLYHRVEAYVSRFYRTYEGHRKGLGFVMTVYRRRLTSSFYALRQSLERRLAFLRGLTSDPGLSEEDLEEADLADDISETLPQDIRGLGPIAQEEIAQIEELLRGLDGLGSDSKFAQLVGDLDRALSRRDSVVIFSQYTDTVDDLRERLRPIYGSRLGCYTGRGGERWDGARWSPVSKEKLKDAFAKGEIQILLGTDALAEGLNLQTCGVEINYDAPWNPMRLEQRIGRIDRIGQRHSEIWIWNYFYAGTVEAVVYERLMTRIRWFEDVVGPLQPILHKVERTIREVALEDPSSRPSVETAKLADLDAEIARAEQEAIDLEAFLEVPPVPPREPRGPISPEALETFLVRSRGVGWRFRPHPTIAGAYLLDMGGEEIGVTFRRDVADEHPDSVSFLTVGHPLLERLLDRLGSPTSGPGRVARLETVDLPRRFVAWYRPTSGGVRLIENLDDLQEALATQPPAEGDWLEQAKADLASRVRAALAREREQRERRAQERRSSLQARGREVLARATYLWLARQAADPAEVSVITGDSVQGLISREGYPFTALARLVGIPEDLTVDSEEWAELTTKSRHQLDGLWRATREEASRLVQRLSGWQPAADLSAVPPPEPEIDVLLY